jgi:hypothetical protein
VVKIMKFISAAMEMSKLYNLFHNKAMLPPSSSLPAERRNQRWRAKKSVEIPYAIQFDFAFSFRETLREPQRNCSAALCASSREALVGG